MQQQDQSDFTAGAMSHDDLLDPEVIAQEIADDLQTALEQFQAITTALKN